MVYYELKIEMKTLNRNSLKIAVICNCYLNIFLGVDFAIVIYKN